MSNQRALTRREFSAESLMALFAGVAITVSGCDDNGSTPGSPTAPSSGDRTGSVSANHGHVAIVTGVQLTAGSGVVLNIRGQADHPHTVELSAPEVIQVRDGQRVSKPSSTDPSPTEGTHQHTVTFN